MGDDPLLQKLTTHLIYTLGEETDLRHNSTYHGTLVHKRDGEIQVYLTLDHCLMFLRESKAANKEPTFELYRPPLKLVLLVVDSDNTDLKYAPGKESIRPSQHRKQSSLIGRLSSVLRSDTKGGDKAGLWIEFTQIGRRGYKLVLQAPDQKALNTWMTVIREQQERMQRQSAALQLTTLCKGFFSDSNRINCAALYGGGTQVLYGTSDGVYMSDRLGSAQNPVKVLELRHVVQLEVIEEQRLLVVLTEKRVVTFTLDGLSPQHPLKGLAQATHICSKVTFLKTGMMNNRRIVSVVDSGRLSSTVRMYDIVHQNFDIPVYTNDYGNPTAQLPLRLYREFHVPYEVTSFHYLTNKICVASSVGFEVVAIDTLQHQPLLDPSEKALEFVQNKKAIASFRINKYFLLCYDEFAFYVDKSGRLARKNFVMFWEGRPKGFALHGPYLVAFDPSFLEVRNVDTGLIEQVIQVASSQLLAMSTSMASHEMQGSQRECTLIRSNEEAMLLSFLSVS